MSSEQDVRVSGLEPMSALAPNELIEHACKVLDLDSGALYEATAEGLGADFWQAHGDWLVLAGRMGADRVFFVDNDPVIVFAAVAEDASEASLVEAYRRAWSLSRPHCLFLARGGELRVYALSAPPELDSAGNATVSPIEIVERAADVETALQRFQRDRVESGMAFEDRVFRSRHGRADHRLIADVTAATDALTSAGLDQAVAHTLIERVILVRYLEDRRVIVPDYLHSVAKRKPDWTDLLQDESNVPNFGAKSTFVQCLADVDLTYAVFEQLAADFNGDLFIADSDERRDVGKEHLHLVKALLEGTATAGQEPLFLWAYDFGVVPTSLISTMYEVFYQQDVVSKLTGTHYTPSELVEFTLAQALTHSVLDRRPRICDPACGSGIFLVEAFRMLVRYESSVAQRRLSADELKAILLDRIAGIDLNEEAVRLAAFSLYLAYLNYQTPQDIRAAGPLPRLIHRGGDDGILVVSDAFAPTLDEEAQEGIASLPLANGAFDVIVGNPPWTEPKASERDLPDDWGDRRELEIGDRNRSQLFLWRALDLLAEDGVATMLVAASAFVNTRETSQAFRRAWLQRVSVSHIVNFAQVRRLFFTKAVAPFFLVTFTPRTTSAGEQLVVYETAVPSSALKQTRSMAFARLDRRVVRQQSIRDDDSLWKVYAWGNHRDEALVARLSMEKRVKAIISEDDGSPGYGYQRGSDRPSPTLKSLPSLKTFAPWGDFRSSDFEDQPDGTKRQPDERIYRGQRILVRRGISDDSFGPYSRLVNEPMTFRHQIFCLPMQSAKPWVAGVVAGTLLSSLGRYFLFMTSGSWGLWHDQIYIHEVLDLPVRLREGHPATARMVTAVDRLQTIVNPPPVAHFAPLDLDQLDLNKAQAELDEAAFDLFDLGDEERDLILDFWARYAQRQQPQALSGVVAQRGSEAPSDDSPIGPYLQTFLKQWNGLLEPQAARLDWEVICDNANVPVLAVTFRVVAVRGGTTARPDSPLRWRDALARYAVASDPSARGMRLYREGLIRAVSDDGIVIVKRNEARLWSRSSAREDAEATMLQATRLRSH
jgi:hypothetical protein